MASLYENTALLLHLNGVDGATSTTDESRFNNSITFNGSSQLDTAQYKFEPSSLLLNGSTDYLSSPDRSEFYLSADFTVEGFFRLPQVPTLSYQRWPIVAHYKASTAQRSWHVSLDTDASANLKLNLTTSATGSLGVDHRSDTLNISADTWYHFAVCRSSDTLYFFIDGILKGTEDVTGIVIGNKNIDLTIGSYDSNYFKGWLDEIRVLNGIAQYTSNFTPPTEEFSIGSLIGTNTELDYDNGFLVNNNFQSIYNIYETISNDFQFKYDNGFIVNSGIYLNYNIYNAINKSLNFSYTIGNQVFNDLAFEYLIKEAIIKDLNFAYNSGITIHADTNISYSLSSYVNKLLFIKYNIQSAITKNLEIDYDTGFLVTKDNEFKYSSQEFVRKNLEAIYRIGYLVNNDIQFVYDYPFIGVNLEINYDNGFLVTKDNQIKYSSQAYVRNNLEAIYILRGILNNSIDFKYNVLANIVNSDSVFKYNVLSSLINSSLLFKYDLSSQLFLSINLINKQSKIDLQNSQKQIEINNKNNIITIENDLKNIVLSSVDNKININKQLSDLNLKNCNLNDVNLKNIIKDIRIKIKENDISIINKENDISLKDTIKKINTQT